jgi:hypothetical protein
LNIKDELNINSSHDESSKSNYVNITDENASEKEE